MKTHRLLCAAVVMLGVITLLSGCQKKAAEPVALFREDACAYCKMVISEKQYAAEFLDSEGEVFKFDDLGCMANFIKSSKTPTKAVAYFVMDFDTRQWTKGEDAYFVRSSQLKTPMNGGIIAFKDQSKAKEAVGRYQGELVLFNDLFKSE